jgi:hypothetical protein
VNGTEKRPVFGPLRLIEGGASPAAPRKVTGKRAVPSRLPGRCAAEGLAQDLSEPVRETERRIGLLLSGDHGILRDAQKEELRAVSEAAELVSSVVSLLALHEREDAGTTEPEETFDVRFVLWDLIEEHAPRARLKRVHLDLSLPDGPLAAYCPRSCTRAVLRFALREHLHLVTPGGRITIRGDGEGGGILVRFERRQPAEAPARAEHGAARALMRAVLERHAGALGLSADGREWRLRFPGAGARGVTARPDPAF